MYSAPADVSLATAAAAACYTSRIAKKISVGEKRDALTNIVARKRMPVFRCQMLHRVGDAAAVLRPPYTAAGCIVVSRILFARTKSITIHQAGIIEGKQEVIALVGDGMRSSIASSVTSNTSYVGI